MYNRHMNERVWNRMWKDAFYQRILVTQFGKFREKVKSVYFYMNDYIVQYLI